MKEELNLDLPDGTKDNLKVISLSREASNVCWTAYAVLDLRGKGPEFSSEAILKKSSEAKDLREANIFQTLDMKDIPEFLKEKESVPATAVFLQYINNQLEIKKQNQADLSTRMTSRFLGGLDPKKQPSPSLT